MNYIMSSLIFSLVFMFILAPILLAKSKTLSLHHTYQVSNNYTYMSAFFIGSNYTVNCIILKIVNFLDLIFYYKHLLFLTIFNIENIWKIYVCIIYYYTGYTKIRAYEIISRHTSIPVWSMLNTQIMVYFFLFIKMPSLALFFMAILIHINMPVIKVLVPLSFMCIEMLTLTVILAIKWLMLTVKNIFYKIDKNVIKIAFAITVMLFILLICQVDFNLPHMIYIRIQDLLYGAPPINTGFNPNNPGGGNNIPNFGPNAAALQNNNNTDPPIVGEYVVKKGSGMYRFDNYIVVLTDNNDVNQTIRKLQDFQRGPLKVLPIQTREVLGKNSLINAPVLVLNDLVNHRVVQVDEYRFGIEIPDIRQAQDNFDQRNHPIIGDGTITLVQGRGLYNRNMAHYPR